MGDEDDYEMFYMKKHDPKRILLLTAFGITIFFIYIFFSGAYFRFSFGNAASPILGLIGTFLITFGGLFLLWGVVMLFLRSSLGSVKLMALGMIMIAIGSYFISPALVGTDGTTTPKGYH